jgi:hypothetical protein
MAAAELSRARVSAWCACSWARRSGSVISRAASGLAAGLGEAAASGNRVTRRVESFILRTQ